MKVDERPRVTGQWITALLLGCLLCSFGALGQSQSPNQNAEPTGPTETPTENTNESTPPAQTAIADKDIIVISGDTFQSISKNEYGTIGFWRLIAEYNELDVDKPLVADQLIKLPLRQLVLREYAEITYAHGKNLIVSENSDSRELVREDSVFLDNIIETGPDGFVSITFRTGTVVNLQPNTRVKLIKLDCLIKNEICFIELDTERGSVSAEVIHDKGTQQQNDFRVNTPKAAAAVRGTTFDIATDSTSMLLGVTEGSVEASAQNRTVNVPTGFGINATADRGLQNLVELLPPPSFTSVSPRLATNDLIACWLISGASSYEWTLSTDVDGAQIISRDVLPDPFFTLGDVAAGDYYLSVRAIDDLGLKGFTSTEKVAVNDTDESIEPVSLTATRADQSLLISVENPPEQAEGYEIQLAISPNFDDAISVDIGTAGEVNFSAVDQPVYVRARVLVNPQVVSAFGPVLAVD